MAALRPPRLDATAEEVARIAAAAPDWATLAAAGPPCVACPELAATRQHVVVGDVPGAGRPRFVLVGEAPGREGGRDRPAVRRPLRRAARPAARPRPGSTAREAAVLNVVKCRPPGNRTPKAPEVARCSGWLRRQLELLDPPVVVALGLSAAKWFLGPRTVLAPGARPAARRRRAGGLGDLPPVGGDPVRSERGPAGRAAGRPSAVAAVAGSP